VPAVRVAQAVISQQAIQLLERDGILRVAGHGADHVDPGPWLAQYGHAPTGSQRMP
jgi:hypothetical protein